MKRKKRRVLILLSTFAAAAAVTDEALQADSVVKFVIRVLPIFDIPETSWSVQQVAAVNAALAIADACLPGATGDCSISDLSDTLEQAVENL